MGVWSCQALKYTDMDMDSATMKQELRYVDTLFTTIVVRLRITPFGVRRCRLQYVKDEAHPHCQCASRSGFQTTPHPQSRQQSNRRTTSITDHREAGSGGGGVYSDR